MNGDLLFIACLAGMICASSPGSPALAETGAPSVRDLPLPTAAEAVPDAAAARAEDQASDLAKKLQNPVANLISVPFQNNFDYGGGSAGHGSQYIVNIQPVIPIHLTHDLNLILRTIVPITQVNHVLPVNVGGIGDIVQSFFFSPVEPVGGLIVGAGPVFLYPTATSNLISANQFAAGPTFVVLKQSGPWTSGVLANHLQGFGRTGRNGDGGGFVLGDDGFETVTPPGRSTRVSATFMQPFVSYTTKSYTTLTASTEATYDWTGRRWSIPLVAGVSQVLKIGSQPISIGLLGKYWAVQPTGAPGWGVRLAVTLLFPT
jgi:hypothetical protein